MSKWSSDIRTPNLYFLHLEFLVYRQKWRLKFTPKNKGGHREFITANFKIIELRLIIFCIKLPLS